LRLRTRILLASGLLIAVPLLLLTLGIRGEMERRLTAQYTARINTLVGIIDEDLARRRQSLKQHLAALKSEIPEDNRFRLAAVEGQAQYRPDLLDYAGTVMELMDLDMLQIQDELGRIISSGHFRNEYGRDEPLLPMLLAQAPEGTALITARQPDGPFLCLARVDSVRLGGQLFHLVGGFRVDENFLADLAMDRDLGISLFYLGGALSTDDNLKSLLQRASQYRLGRPATILSGSGYLIRDLELPLADTSGPRVNLTKATLIVTHPSAPLRELLRSLNIWLGLVLLATLAGTLVLAFWLSGRISRPLNDLARKTARLDLDNLDTDFTSTRQDEVGTLSRFLAAMTVRLSTSVQKLREAERRATLVEVARQVNHDIRNGLTPLRNVFRHLSEVAERNPTETSRVLSERRGTLEAGIAYLEELAGNYARLTPARPRQPCDLNAIIRTAIPTEHNSPSSTRVAFSLAPDLPAVLAEPIGLRRIIENLVRNGMESLPAHAGCVRVATELRTNMLSETDLDPSTDRAVALIVADDGCGIPPEQLDRIFEDFFTTKEGGTGLGLSNVRRLVADFEGTITVASEPAKGTIFTVTFPIELSAPSANSKELSL